VAYTARTAAPRCTGAVRTSGGAHSRQPAKPVVAINASANTNQPRPAPRVRARRMIACSAISPRRRAGRMHDGAPRRQAQAGAGRPRPASGGSLSCDSAASE
jgi:hypothetical protein